VKSVVSTLISGGKVEHAYLGVTVGDASSGQGAELGSIKDGTPAAKAGLQAGDVVTAIDGQTVENADDLTAKISAHHPGDKVTLTVTRNGATKTISVTLGTRPS
jgi:putative serine protease PepD